MKRIILSVLTMFLTTLGFAHGTTGDTGFGIVMGDSTGPTLKYFTSNKTAIDVGLGFSDNFKVYADLRI